MQPLRLLTGGGLMQPSQHYSADDAERCNKSIAWLTDDFTQQTNKLVRLSAGTGMRVCDIKDLLHGLAVTSPSEKLKKLEALL